MCPTCPQLKTCSEREHWLELGEAEQGPLVPFLPEARSDLAHLSPSHTLLCTKQALILVELWLGRETEALDRIGGRENTQPSPGRERIRGTHTAKLSQTYLGFLGRQ